MTDPKIGVGADILIEAHQLITGPRNDTYGDVVDDYSKVIDIFHFGATLH